MRDKVLLQALLPATQERYEFRVPFDLTVEQAAGLMARILTSREQARFASSDGMDLMLVGEDVAGAGNQLNPNETLRALVEQGVLGDGSEVALV